MSEREAMRLSELPRIRFLRDWDDKEKGYALIIFNEGDIVWRCGSGAIGFTDGINGKRTDGQEGGNVVDTAVTLAEIETVMESRP